MNSHQLHYFPLSHSIRLDVPLGSQKSRLTSEQLNREQLNPAFDWIAQGLSVASPSIFHQSNDFSAMVGCKEAVLRNTRRVRVTRGGGFWRIDAGCSEAFELAEFSPVPG